MSKLSNIFRKVVGKAQDISERNNPNYAGYKNLGFSKDENFNRLHDEYDKNLTNRRRTTEWDFSVDNKTIVGFYNDYMNTPWRIAEVEDGGYTIIKGNGYLSDSESDYFKTKAAARKAVKSHTHYIQKQYNTYYRALRKLNEIERVFKAEIA